MPGKPARPTRRGVALDDARRMLLQLPGVVEGRSYGYPAFLLNGRFLARFRDDDTVLVLQLATMFDREVLMQMDARAFFFTEHYRNYPAVLVRLSEISRTLLATILRDAWEHVSTLPPKRPKPAPRARAKRPRR